MPQHIELYEVATGRSLGEIGEPQLRQLFDLLEEESEVDRDYWIDGETLELLIERGADAGLVARLRDALGAREGFDVGWREVG